MADMNLTILGGSVPFLGSATSLSSTGLFSTTDKVAFVFQATADDTITHAILSFSVQSGTPPTCKVSLQGVNSSGMPDGTVKGGGSPASATFTPPASSWNNSTQEIAFDNSVSVTRGEWLSLVVEYSSGTVDFSNAPSFIFSATVGSCGFPVAAAIYRSQFGGSLVRQSGSATFAYKSATAVYGQPLATFSTTSAVTSGHRAGLRFKVPSGATGTLSVSGFVFTGKFSAAGTVKAGIWDGTTEVGSVSFDSDAMGASSQDQCVIFFDSPVQINADTAYYAAIEGSGGTTLYIASWDLADAAYLAVFEGGSEFYLGTFDGSAWTDDTTKRPQFGLILSDMTAPAGGGTYVNVGTLINNGTLVY